MEQNKDQKIAIDSMTEIIDQDDGTLILWRDRKDLGRWMEGKVVVPVMRFDGTHFVATQLYLKSTT